MSRRRKRSSGLGDAIMAMVFLSLPLAMFKDNPMAKVLLSFIAIPIIFIVAVVIIKLIVSSLRSVSTTYPRQSYRQIRSDYGYEPHSRDTDEEIDLYPVWKSSDSPLVNRQKPNAWSLKLLKEIEWKRFEELVAEYFRLKGFKADTTALGKDEGVDVMVYGKESGKLVSVVQCKAWSNPVRLREVRELLGTIVAKKVKQGIFITTSMFTSDALTFGKVHGLVLLDGNDFLKEIKNLGEVNAQKLLDKVTTGEYWIPACPKCGIKMKVRQNRKNNSKFWACPRFPRCRGTLSMQASQYSKM